MSDSAVKLWFVKDESGTVVRLGRGSFGLVIKGECALAGEERAKPCAIKLAKDKNTEKDFLAEYDAIHALNEQYARKRGRSEAALSRAYFPAVYSLSYIGGSGIEGVPAEACGFVMELLGPSIGSAFGDPSFARGIVRQYALFVLAARSFEILDFLMKEGGVVHRDIKPDNFLLPNARESDVEGVARARLIDFGFSTDEAKVKAKIERYRLDKYAKRRSSLGKKAKPDDVSVECMFVGSPRYCSVLAHMGHPPSYAGDFEATLYTLLHCYYGSLPWQKNRQDDCDRVMMNDTYALASSDPKIEKAIRRSFPHETIVGYYKANCDTDGLARGKWLSDRERERAPPLPGEFATLLEMARTKRLAASERWKERGSPPFDVKPDYATARDLALRAARRLRDEIALERSRQEKARLV